MCVVGGVNEVERKMCRGGRQGSICGPAVWNMMLDGLLEEIGRMGISYVAYADDLLCMIGADNRKDIEDVGPEVMEMVVAWGNAVGVEMSREKTVMMLLKGSLSDSKPPNVTDKRVTYVKEVKYLGIRVSERMNIRSQVESLAGRMIGMIWKLRRALRKEWGLDKRTVRVIQKELVVACVSFGAGVWCDVLRFGYARELVNTSQRSVLQNTQPLRSRQPHCDNKA